MSGPTAMRIRLTIGRGMSWIAATSIPLAVACRYPLLGVVACVCITLPGVSIIAWFGLIRALIRMKRREIERERRRPVDLE